MGLRKAGGRPRSPQLGAARTPPPPFTQRGPGTPLPASAAEPAQACGLHSRHCCRAGLWAAAPTGVVRPCSPHPPGRPGGCVTPRPWPRAGSCLTAAPALLLAEGRGAGAVQRRRRPQGLQANPPLFFSHSLPPAPVHTRKGFPDTLAEVSQFRETGPDHFRWGKSHLFGVSGVALGPRPAGPDG